MGRTGKGSLLFIGFFVCLALVVEGRATRERNEVWRTDEGLWADAVVKSPRNGRAWMNLGVAQMAKGRYADAEYSFERAHLYAPTYSLIEVNLGVLCGALGRDREAEWHFQQAIKIAPDDPASHTYYDSWRQSKGRR